MTKISKFIHQLYCLDESNRNKGIEGLRALAVLMVFNSHVLSSFYFNNFYIENNQLLLSILKFIQSGHFGVDIFFVISGYLIYTTTIRSNPTFLQYFRRRFMRLMPAHIAVLLFVIPSGYIFSSLIENIFFLPSFIRNIPIYNYVTWSLGWEWLFYLIFFILYKVKSKASDKFFLLGVLFFSLILVALTCPILSFTSIIKDKYDIPLPGRFFGFYIGIFVAYLEAAIIKRNLEKLVPLISMIGIIGFVFWTWVYSVFRDTPQFNDYGNLNFYFIILDLLVGMVILGLIFPDAKSFVYKFFSLKLFRIVGQVSYSFYLIHTVVGIPIGIEVIKVSKFEDIFIYYLVTFVICFLIATVVFMIFERPFISRRRKHTYG